MSRNLSFYPNMSRTIIKVPLEYLSSRDDIPVFLPVVAAFIKQHASTHGIFRIPGQQAKLLTINEQLAQHVPHLPSNINVADVVSFFKLWLKSLPTPLLSPDIVNKYIGQGTSEEIIEVIKNLPSINRRCFAIIISIMNSILENSQQNSMSFGNLSICFASSLTQENKHLNSWLPLRSIYDVCSNCLTADETDFTFINSPNCLSNDENEFLLFNAPQNPLPQKKLIVLSAC